MLCLQVEIRGAQILCMENMRLLGKEDCGVANDDESNLLRLLVPLSKLYSGKQVPYQSMNKCQIFSRPACNIVWSKYKHAFNTDIKCPLVLHEKSTLQGDGVFLALYFI